MPRILRYAFLALLGLVIIALALPFVIPVDSYRDRIAEEASRTLHRDVVLGGELSLQILPSLQITARLGAMDGRWPSEPEALQPVARAMMEASKTLAARILDMLEPRACPNLERGTLQKSHTLWGPGGQCTLRLLHYPPTAPPEAGSNLWRAGPHTDWCCVTLLYQLPGPRAASGPILLPVAAERGVASMA